MKRFSSILVSSLLLIQASPVTANESINYEIPSTSVSQFDAVESSGGIVVRDIDALKALGYDPSRQWNPGDSIADTLQLSDLNKITPVTDKSYDQIFKASGVQASNVQLGDAPLLKRQTIGDWLQANPNKANAALKGYPALQQLIAGNWEQSVVSGWAIASEHSEEFQKILEKHPELKDLPVASIVQGDWKGTLPYAQQLALKEIDRHLPEHLKGLPGKSLGVVNDIRQGNFDRAAVGAVSIADAIRKAPNLKDIPIGALGDKVPVSAIPGLKDTPIGQLAGWEGSKVSETPGLKETPLDYVSINTIIGLLNGDLFGALDVPRSEAELSASNPISGGTRGGPLTPEPCQVTDDKKKDKKSKAKACPHIELQDVDSKKSLGGKQWISGKYQKVKGGKGFLKKINGGWEPTGLKPWGPKPPLKLVLLDVTETDGKQIQTDTGITVSEKAGYGKFAMYAQFCVKKLFVDLGCSPHFIGPIPFVLHPKVRQNGRVLIASSSGPPPIPDEWQRRIDAYAGQYAPQCEPGESPSEVSPDDEKYGYRAIAEVDESDLVTLKTEADGYKQQLHREAAEAFTDLQAAAAKDGVNLDIGSGYRSNELQKSLFDQQVARRGSVEEALKRSAPPEYSEHGSGYAADIIDSDRPDAVINDRFTETEGYRWLKDNAKKHGWEQSYDGNHSEPTGVESWHFRYVGSDNARQALNLRDSVQTAHDGHDHDGHAHDGHDNRNPGDAAISSVRKPQNEREEFLAKTVALAEKYGLPPEELLTVFSFETSGTLSPSITNSDGYTGLIQFGADTARDLGTSTAALRQLSRVEQLDWVDRYFEQRGLPKNATTEQLYATVLVGNPGGNLHITDSNRTSVASAIRHHFPAHRQKAIALLQGAENLDSSGYTFSGGGAVDCVASGAGGGASGNFVQGDGQGRGNFIPPVDRGVDSGYRTAERPNHNGTDHFIPIGTPIKASDGGVVIDVETQCATVGYRGNSCGGKWGNFVQIRHPNGWTTVYAHLKSTPLRKDMKVSQGQVIGESGSSGSSEGPHLHFETWTPDGKRVNPAQQIYR